MSRFFTVIKQFLASAARAFFTIALVVSLPFSGPARAQDGGAGSGAFLLDEMLKNHPDVEIKGRPQVRQGPGPVKRTKEFLYAKKSTLKNGLKVNAALVGVFASFYLLAYVLPNCFSNWEAKRDMCRWWIAARGVGWAALAAPTFRAVDFTLAKTFQQLASGGPLSSFARLSIAMALVSPIFNYMHAPVFTDLDKLIEKRQLAEIEIAGIQDQIRRNGDTLALREQLHAYRIELAQILEQYSEIMDNKFAIAFYQTYGDGSTLSDALLQEALRAGNLLLHFNAGIWAVERMSKAAQSAGVEISDRRNKTNVTTAVRTTKTERHEAIKRFVEKRNDIFRKSKDWLAKEDGWNFTKKFRQGVGRTVDVAPQKISSTVVAARGWSTNTSGSLFRFVKSLGGSWLGKTAFVMGMFWLAGQTIEWEQSVWLNGKSYLNLMDRYDEFELYAEGFLTNQFVRSDETVIANPFTSYSYKKNQLKLMQPKAYARTSETREGLSEVGTSEKKEDIFTFEDLILNSAGMTLALSNIDDIRQYYREGVFTKEFKAKADEILGEAAAQEFEIYKEASYFNWIASEFDSEKGTKSDFERFQSEDFQRNGRPTLPAWHVDRQTDLVGFNEEYRHYLAEFDRKILGLAPRAMRNSPLDPIPVRNKVAVLDIAKKHIEQRYAQYFEWRERAIRSRLPDVVEALEGGLHSSSPYTVQKMLAGITGWLRSSCSDKENRQNCSRAAQETQLGSTGQRGFVIAEIERLVGVYRRLYKKMKPKSTLSFLFNNYIEASEKPDEALFQFFGKIALKKIQNAQYADINGWKAKFEYGGVYEQVKPKLPLGADAQKTLEDFQVNLQLLESAKVDVLADDSTFLGQSLWAKAAVAQTVDKTKATRGWESFTEDSLQRQLYFYSLAGPIQLVSILGISEENPQADEDSDKVTASEKTLGKKIPSKLRNPKSLAFRNEGIRWDFFTMLVLRDIRMMVDQYLDQSFLAADLRTRWLNLDEKDFQLLYNQPNVSDGIFRQSFNGPFNALGDIGSMMEVEVAKATDSGIYIRLSLPNETAAQPKDDAKNTVDEKKSRADEPAKVNGATGSSPNPAANERVVPGEATSSTSQSRPETPQEVADRIEKARKAAADAANQLKPPTQ
ncbi:MAG: hypothetical protein COT74_06275 [Bdellovibrionales bacterium CG10_big_fil_rev_8_21_14_0_10_45_34]|nr:MAG: hypothetical protein COT74_06275 [Bdellovibrionales bacterium CG10_big_fil_rev_8_21_14_0_10_45_34]